MIDLNDKHIAVLRKAAAVVKDRGHEGDARLADSVLGIVASVSARASTPAPQAAPSGWKDALYAAMDKAFSIREKKGSAADGGMVINDTQVGVEFAMDWFEKNFAAPLTQAAYPLASRAQAFATALEAAANYIDQLGGDSKSARIALVHSPAATPAAPLAQQREPVALTATHGPLHLTNPKTASIVDRGYNVVGYVLRRADGEEICLSAESAVRWLPQAHYWRLMHEQDGSLFAAPLPAQQASESADDASEGLELLANLMKNIEKDGNYSAEATLTFLSQIKQCFAAMGDARKGEPS